MYDNEHNKEVQSPKKKLGPQLIVGAIILVAFITVVNVTTEPQEVAKEYEENQVPEEDSEDHVSPPARNYPEVESEEELIAYFGMDIIGLEKAYELGLVKDINQTIELEDLDRTLIIEKAWYTANGIYLIESINQKGDEDIRARFWTEFFNEYGSTASKQHYGTQVKLNGRIYNIQELRPIRDDKGNLLTQVDGKYTYEVAVRSENHTKRIKDVELPLSYNSEGEASFTHHFDIHKTIKGEDIEFTFNSIDLSLNGGTINLDYKIQSVGLFGLNGYIKLNEERRDFDTRYRRDNFSSLEIPMISDNPESLEIHIDKAYMVSDHELDFEVNLSEIEKGKTVLDEYIGEHMGTEYYLKSLDYKGGELEVMTEAYLPGGESVTRNEINHITPANFGHVESQTVPNLLTVTNSEGEEFNFRNFSSTGSDSTKGFTLPPELVKNFDTANINISNLSYIEDIDQTVEIDLSGS